MPQENQVLRCCSCKMFQVHLVKKAKKWECKICSTKQSLKLIYGKGSGKDCRLHVMELNKYQFSEDEKSLLEETGISDCKMLQADSILDPLCDANQKQITSVEPKSKWSNFIDEVKTTIFSEDVPKYQFPSKKCPFQIKRKLAERFDPLKSKKFVDHVEEKSPTFEHEKASTSNYFGQHNTPQYESTEVPQTKNQYVRSKCEIYVGEKQMADDIKFSSKSMNEEHLPEARIYQTNQKKELSRFVSYPEFSVKEPVGAEQVFRQASKERQYFNCSHTNQKTSKLETKKDKNEEKENISTFQSNEEDLDNILEF